MMRPLRLPRTECAHGSAFHLRLFPVRWSMRRCHLPAVLIGLLVPAVALPAACPVDQVKDATSVISGWPTNKSPPDDTWDLNVIGAQGGIYHCGHEVLYSSYSHSFQWNQPLATQIAAAHTRFSSLTVWTGSDTRQYLATCAGDGWVKIIYRITHGTMQGVTTTVGAQINNWGTVNTPCDPPAQSCTAGEGWLTQVVTNDIAATEAAYAGTCFNTCKIASAKRQSIGTDCDSTGACSFVMVLRNEGGNCDTQPPATPTPDPVEEDPIQEDPTTGQEYCVTSSAGTEVCASDAYGENCGYVNDKFVCLGKTDPDECWINADGSRLCGEAAPTPPVPDNGTRGVKATPDDKLGAVGPSGAQNTYNYYNTTTVAGSSAPPGTDGSNPNRPGSSNPSTSPTPVVDVGGGGGGDGDGDGGGDFPALDETCTFAECGTAFYNAVSQGPWGQSLQFGAIGGSCPSYSFSAYGETFDFDVICVWYEDIKPLLALLVTLVGGLVGFRIVMSA